MMSTEDGVYCMGIESILGVGGRIKYGYIESGECAILGIVFGYGECNKCWNYYV